MLKTDHLGRSNAIFTRARAKKRNWIALPACLLTIINLPSMERCWEQTVINNFDTENIYLNTKHTDNSHRLHRVDFFDRPIHFSIQSIYVRRRTKVKFLKTAVETGSISWIVFWTREKEWQSDSYLSISGFFGQYVSCGDRSLSFIAITTHFRWTKLFTHHFLSQQ